MIIVSIAMNQSLYEKPTNSDWATPDSTRLRIILADDNSLLLGQLERILRKEFEIVGTVGDGRALLEQYDRLHPDVIVTDISMPVMGGFEAVKELTRGGKPKVVFLTVHEELAFVEEAKTLGAMGYVLKREHPSALVEAIRSAYEGHFYLCPNLRK